MTQTASENTIKKTYSGYETTYITRSELSDESLKVLQERLAQLVASYDGELVLTEDWGKKKLAYPIQKETRGQYNYLVYTGRPDVVHELERNLRLNEHVLRFLTVHLSQNFDPVVFRKQRSDVHAAAKRREEEREARREERNAERRAFGDDRSDYRRHDLDDGDDLMGNLGDHDEI
jgi:small subunit ribosomal protein S6